MDIFDNFFSWTISLNSHFLGNLISSIGETSSQHWTTGFKGLKPRFQQQKKVFLFPMIDLDEEEALYREDQ